MGKLFSKSRKNKYSSGAEKSTGSEAMGTVESQHLHHQAGLGTDYRTPIHDDSITAVFPVRPGVCLSGSKDKTVVLYDYQTGQVQERWTGHEKEVTKVLYGDACQRYFSASRDKSVQIWACGVDKSLGSFVGHELVVTAMDVNTDNSQMCSGSRDNTVRLWDVGTRRELRQSFISRNLVSTVKWVKNSVLVVQGGEDKEVRVFDTRTMEIVFSFPRKQYIQMCCDVSEDGLYCLTCSNGFDGSGCEATLWDLRSRSLVCEYKGHTEAVESCAFLPHRDGHLLVTSSRDCSVRVWDRDTKVCVCDFVLSGSGPLTSIAPYADGSMCVGSFNLGIQLLQLSLDDGKTSLIHRAQF